MQSISDLDHARYALNLVGEMSKGMPFRHALCCFPVLLRASVRDELREVLKDDKRSLDILSQADAIAPQVIDGTLPFATGGTPIEVIAQRVEQGEIAMDDAVVIARQPAVVDQLLPVYVGCLSNYAVKLAHNGDWRKALPLLRLLRAALASAKPSAETTENLNIVESSWVEAAIWSLVEVPDRRLLEDAEQCGLRVVGRTNPSDGEDYGLALMRLGVLYLDPFVKFRDLGRYSAAYELWHEAFSHEYGASASKVPPKEWRMPPLDEALPKAIDYLQRSADARKGRLRGLALKALAEALESKALFTKQPVGDDVRKAASEALQLMDPRDVDRITSLRALLKRLGVTETTSIASDDSSAVPGMNQVTLAFEKARGLANENPISALEMLRDAREVFNRYGYPQQRLQRLAAMAQLLLPAFAPEEQPDTWGKTWDEKLGHLDARVSKRSLNGRHLAVCALHLAFMSQLEDAEERALPLIQVAVQSDPGLAKEYEELFRFASYQLYNGAGVNFFNAKQFGRAATTYLAALGASLGLGLKNLILDQIERVNDVLAKAGDIPFPDRALELLASNWLGCESQLEEAGALQLVEVSAQLDRCLKSDVSEDFNTAWLLWQVAKGFRFATSLSAGPQPVPEAETKLLDEIRRIERNVVHKNVANDEVFLVSWLRQKGGGKGLTDEIRLANVQHTFDVAREKRLSATTRKPLFLSTEEALEKIAPDTALVPLFLGQGPELELAVRWLCLYPGAGGGASRIAYPVPRRQAIIDRDGYELIVPPLADLVGRVRELIQAEPGFGSVSKEAAEMLETWEAGLTGRLRELITTNRQIKHVCFCPHGPLHFMPLHLLGASAALLADIAVVTYLPSMALLARPDRPLRSGILAVGMGFQGDDSRRLAPISDAPAEAKEIAALFKTAPLPEVEATPARLLEELPRHRYVHIATHGSQNAIAPAFHNLIVQPDSEKEDRLFAHSIDRLDLSGLDLVTLSACESALGRVDPSDNLRGLAASLFRAGARTIVGTLWPTGSKVCRTFFVALYRELRGGATKRSAFAVAQKETRKQHPQYRAWASFYMMGDWR